MKSRRISNQPTYKSRSYKLAAIVTYYIKFATSFRIHLSSEYKVITKQVHNKVAEANSFETSHTLSLNYSAS
jgi:hypothetical protein